MYYSGLIVTARPKRFTPALEAIRAIEGVEIHQSDPDTGRAVVVLEEESVGAETDKFRRIKEIPDVIDVSLVVHREDTGIS